MEFENKYKIINVLKNIIIEPSYDFTSPPMLYLRGFFIFSPANDDKGSETASIIKEEAMLYLYSQNNVAIKMNANGKNIVPSVFLFKL